MASLRRSVKCQDEVGEDHHWSLHLIEKVTIVSRLKGRIRFNLGFEGDEILSDSIRRELHKIESVRLRAYSTRTKTALVTFDANEVSEFEVVSALFRGIKELARLHGECDLKHHHHKNSKINSKKTDHAHDHEHAHEDNCDHDHSALATDAGIRKELFKLIFTGGVLAALVYRRLNGSASIFKEDAVLNLASLVTILSGYPIFRAGFDSVKKQKKATDDTLIGIAVLASLLMGESLTGFSVVWLINLGRLLEAITLKRSRTALRDLMDIAPTEAWHVSMSAGQNQVIKRVAVEDIEKGQIIRIFASEKAPLDGKILKGKALVQEAFITGESIPVEKNSGDIVYAGSLISHGEIDIEVTNLVHDTVVARMIDAIENMREQKAPIGKTGARFASHFVPISLGISALTLLLTGDLRRAITMLVVACPCAAGLATPTAVSASIGQAARKGILIKGGTHLESAAKIDTVVFDKTGTLTLGEPILHDFKHIDKSLSFEECLILAASAEQYTTHPLGMVLISEAKKRKLSLLKISSHKVYPGMGLTASLGAKKVRVGNEKLMGLLKIDIPKDFAQELKSYCAGESILFLAVSKSLKGAFIVSDPIRPQAHQMLVELKKLGVKHIVLASGDRKGAAVYIGKQIGIKEIHSELLPEGKLKLISSLKAKGYKVAMVGDGVNDAQALSEADLSIAMGAGRCDVAIEAADITLARNDLLLVPEVLDISQKTLKTIYQNLAASVGINAGGMAFSAFGQLSPFAAALVHNASTIAVVLNSLRLGKQVAGSHPLQTLKEVSI